MNIFYTHHRDATGTIVLTELKLSSGITRWYIAWHTTEEVVFELIKPILKFPPVAKRSYDESTKIWSYFDNYGKEVINKAVEITKSVGIVTPIEVEDLAWLAAQETFNVRKKRTPVHPEDFFYQHAVGGSIVETKESVAPKLATLLGCEVATLTQAVNGELKKLYRAAALRLHPDRNGGDSAAMSELNMLWRIYNS